MSWTESELYRPSWSSQLKESLWDEDFTDFTEAQRQEMLHQLEVRGASYVLRMIEEYKGGA